MEKKNFLFLHIFTPELYARIQTSLTLNTENIQNIIILNIKMNIAQTGKASLPIGSRWTGRGVGAALWTVVALATDAIVVIVCFGWGGFSCSLQGPVACTHWSCGVGQTCNTDTHVSLKTKCRCLNCGGGGDGGGQAMEISKTRVK